MISADRVTPEQMILRACLRRELSLEDAFGDLYALYAPVVRGWLLVTVKSGEVDDLFQDIWVVFYRRWQQWQFLPEMQEPDACPVASFLYRTFRFVLEGHKRRAAIRHESIEDVDVYDNFLESDKILQRAELGQCLNLARRICPRQELDVLMAKLAGIPARDIAEALAVTESVVDHRFRRAIARLKKHLKR